MKYYVCIIMLKNRAFCCALVEIWSIPVCVHLWSVYALAIQKFVIIIFNSTAAAAAVWQISLDMHNIMFF